MKTITVLPNNEIKYVKSIIFMVELFGRLYTGKIVYKREPSDNYKKYPAAYRRYRCCCKEWQDVLACIY